MSGLGVIEISGLFVVYSSLYDDVKNDEAQNAV